MKRYENTLDDMREHSKGEWVRWEDSKAELFRFAEIYENRIKDLKDEIMTLRGVVARGN